MSDKRKRQQTIRFRVSKDEEAFIQAQAKEARLPVGTFAREVVLAAANGSPLTASAKSEAILLRDILAEINRTSIMAKGRSFSPDATPRIVGELQRLQLLILRSFRGDQS